MKNVNSTMAGMREPAAPHNIYLVVINFIFVEKCPHTLWSVRTRAERSRHKHTHTHTCAYARSQRTHHIEL